MDKCPHGTPAGDVVAATAALRDEVAAIAGEVDATASNSNTPAGDVVAATAALRDEVAAAREKHSELQEQLVWALAKIDAVTEDNKTLGDLLSLLKNQTIELVHAEIDKLTESNQELKRIAKEQENKSNTWSTRFGSTQIGTAQNGPWSKPEGPKPTSINSQICFCSMLQPSWTVQELSCSMFVSCTGRSMFDRIALLTCLS